MRHTSAWILPALSLAGCMNLSGVDGASKYACGAPDGINCMSVSGVSYNLDQGNMPAGVKARELEEQTRFSGQAAHPTSSKMDGKPTPSQPWFSQADAKLSPARMETLSSGATVRVPPKELRIWMAPTDDTDGDLHDQRHIYVVVHDGRWIIDSTRINTRDAYTRLYPLGSTQASQRDVRGKTEAPAAPAYNTTPPAAPGTSQPKK